MILRSLSKFLIQTGLIVVFTSGCVSICPFRIPAASLTGSWQFKDKSQGPLILTFKKDGTFIVDSNADGQRDIWGRFELLENRIKFIDDKPRIISDCYEPGFFYYAIYKDELNFTLLADQCKPRKFILSLSFVRLKNK